MRHQILLQRVIGLHPGAQGDIGIDALALHIMRVPHHGGFSDGVMGDKRAFDLGRAHTVAGHIDHIIDAAGDPPGAVGIAARAIAGEVIARIGRKIGVDEALMVAIDGAHLAGPAVGDDKIALRGTFDQLAFGIDEFGLDPEHG